MLKGTIAALPKSIVPAVVKNIMYLATVYPNAIYQQPETPVATETATNGCEYGRGVVKDGPTEEGCIVGQAVRMESPELFELIRNSTTSACMLFKPEGVRSTEVNWIMEVQREQDDGKMWSDCVKVACERYNLRN